MIAAVSTARSGDPALTNPRKDEADLLRWQRELLRFAHRLTGDTDTAEDVVQETIVRFLRVRESKELENPRAWLFRVATNVVRDVARRRETAQRLAPKPDDEPVAAPDTDYERKETIAKVREALARLPMRDRELLLMRESGFRYREIADVIGVKPESVSTLARRALAKFEAAYRAEIHHDASE